MPRRIANLTPCRCALALLCIAGLMAGGTAMASEDAAASEGSGDGSLPVYEVEPCCELCSKAFEPAAYESGYLESFEMLAQGYEGWLFRTRDDLPDRLRLEPESYAVIGRLQRTLADMGVQLVMVPLPPRGLMAWDRLPPYLADESRRRSVRVSYEAMLEDLRAEGVVVPNLAALLDSEPKQPFYFRRDHHWTPYGARATARATAEAIRRIDGFADLPARSFDTRQQGVVTKSGTLVSAVERLCGFGYPEMVTERFVTSSEGQGADLFGDAQRPQVVLAGTSNSAGAYNFAGFLAQALGVDVLNQSVVGGGLESSMLQLLLSDAFRDDPPRVVVWEMPAYSNFNEESVHRELDAARFDGCADRETVLSAEKPLDRIGLTEVLFNGGGEVRSVRSENLIVDVQLSSPAVKELELSVWYINGKNDQFTIEHSDRVDTDGRFMAALRATPDYRDAVFMGLDIGPGDEPLPDGTTASVRLCTKPRFPGGSDHDATQAVSR